MIISHRYRFIFLRTEKTASTSLTSALRETLGDDALHAGLKRPGWAKYSPVHHGALKRNLPDLFGLHPHATARQVRRVLGPEIFDSYYKFAVERNPWERQVSLYFHREWKKGNGEPDFDRDIRSRLYRNTEYVRLNNWSIYAIGENVVADRVLRYERLEDDLAELSETLEFPAPLTLPKLRNYTGERAHYATFYSDESRRLVARWYAREIQAFDYRFETPGAAVGTQTGKAAAFAEQF
jgi:hypothetical protein